MQINLSGHHVEITDSMRNYVNEKIDKLDRHFDQALDIHIVLTVEKLRHKAEATLHVSGSSATLEGAGFELRYERNDSNFAGSRCALVG